MEIWYGWIKHMLNRKIHKKRFTVHPNKTKNSNRERGSVSAPNTWSSLRVLVIVKISFRFLNRSTYVWYNEADERKVIEIEELQNIEDDIEPVESV
jgi:hypothetical protein